MSFKRIDENLNIHQSLPDQPTLEAQELKQKFDEAANIIKDYINNTFLPELEEKGTFSDGNTYTFKQKIIAPEGIEGNVKGGLQGNVEGNVKGNVEGDVKGNVTGNVNGNITGSSSSCTGNARNSN